MLGRGLLLRDDNGWLRRPAAATPAFGALAALGRLLGETLERYAMALLLAAEQYAGVALACRQFERDCRLLAERAALLMEHSAPEFFDPALFRGYLDTLIEVGGVSADEGGALQVDARIGRIAERSVGFLSDEARQTLLQLLLRRPKPGAG